MTETESQTSLKLGQSKKLETRHGLEDNKVEVKVQKELEGRHGWSQSSYIRYIAQNNKAPKQQKLGASAPGIWTLTSTASAEIVASVIIYVRKNFVCLCYSSFQAINCFVRFAQKKTL